MNPWLCQLGRVVLHEMLIETPPYSPRTPLVHGRSEAGAQGTSSSRGASRRGQPTPPEAYKKAKEVRRRDTDDARVAELRKRYKKVQDEPDGATRSKGSVDKDWF